jgi:hypothetical protein
MFRAAGWKAAVSLSTSGLLNSSTPEFNERTGNVYENKEQGKKVEESKS